MCVWVAQSWLTFCDFIYSSPPGSSVYRILQSRILEWVAISSSRGSCWPRDRTYIFCIGRWILYKLYHLCFWYPWEKDWNHPVLIFTLEVDLSVSVLAMLAFWLILCSDRLLLKCVILLDLPEACFSSTSGPTIPQVGCAALGRNQKIEKPPPHGLNDKITALQLPASSHQWRNHRCHIITTITRTEWTRFISRANHSTAQ